MRTDTLYATDLDGTLLDSRAKLSDASGALLRQLLEQGTLFSFITARTPATIEPILSPLWEGQAVPGAPHHLGVAMTGAAIWDCTARQYAHVAYHKEEDVIEIIDICRRCGVTPFVYTLPRGTNSLVVYHEAGELYPVERRFVADRTLNDLKTFHLDTPPPPSTAATTVLFFAMGAPGPIEAVAAEIRERTQCYASCYPDTYNPGVALLEVFTQGVSKAAGLQTLRRLTGAKRVVAFGDNLNDIPMLRAADVAVAVENAHPLVLEAADVVIGPNTADAVPRFIMAD